MTPSSLQQEKKKTHNADRKKTPNSLAAPCRTTRCSPTVTSSKTPRRVRGRSIVRVCGRDIAAAWREAIPIGARRALAWRARLHTSGVFSSSCAHMRSAPPPTALHLPRTPSEHERGATLYHHHPPTIRNQKDKNVGHPCPSSDAGARNGETRRAKSKLRRPIFLRLIMHSHRSRDLAPLKRKPIAHVKSNVC
jgi:hypothetical protein